MRSKEQIKELLFKVLNKLSAPQAQVEYYYNNTLATRFGENAITQNIGGEEENLSLQVAYNQKHGNSITNKIDQTAIKNLVLKAENIAQVSLEDPEYMPPLKPKNYPPYKQRFFKQTLKITPVDLADKVYKTIKIAKQANLKASGFYELNYSIFAIANSEHLFAFDKVSNLNLSTTMHGAQGSGFASENGESPNNINVKAMVKRAAEIALASQNPRDIEPGDYTVIFEPQAVIDLLYFLAWNMSQRNCDEGTTVFSGKSGQKLFNDKVNITTRIDDPELPAPPFGQDGLPSRSTVWIKKGIVKRLHHDRFWASEKKTEPDPILGPLFMQGEDRTMADLIAMCRKGLLVKRLWYIRYVDKRELMLTGITRDGFFRVENGKIIHPVKNLRFNESPVVFLQNIIAMSRAQRVGKWAKVPGIMSSNFTFSSKTESV